MTPSGNTLRLKELMSVHKLRAADVAVILDRKPNTVREWRCANANDIPDNLLKLLEVQLARREATA